MLAHDGLTVNGPGVTPPGPELTKDWLLNMIRVCGIIFVSRGRLLGPHTCLKDTSGIANSIVFEQTGSCIVSLFCGQVCHDPAGSNAGAVLH